MIAFDVDTDASHVGRLVRMRDTHDSVWVYGAAMSVETKWNVENYLGYGVQRNVERHTGRYRLIYGHFNDQDAAQAALFKVIAREDAGEEVLDAILPKNQLYNFNTLVKYGLLEFTDDLDN
uniref:Uncharacterized protein n=1 Tax=Mantoniella antarctica TaxID=81844 RepID=A0A7S0XCQ2_9CHLO|mmetsp:Transcript_34583/g.86787  ORF Transcript_34583/g.86787 Transcript_34583/m.86787 type:complete len:121 (+) Transcript_34583:312-674(+)